MSTKLWIWKQGPYYPHLGKKVIELPYAVLPGPSDHQVVITGYNVQPDSNGNFINGDYSPEDQDAIHTYGIVRMVIDMYEALLGKNIVWPWNVDGRNFPLQVIINGDGIRTQYDSETRSIILEKYGLPDARIHTCRTVDLVAHEVGHAIIHSLKPGWKNGNAEIQGLVEAFCDFTAMYWLLSQEEMCEEILHETNGDLRQSNMLSLFGAGHGYAENPHSAIRDATNRPPYIPCHWNPYHHSEALVGWLYQILVDEWESNPAVELSGHQLFKLGKKWASGIVTAVQGCPEDNPDVMEFGSLFLREYGFKTGEIKKRLKSLGGS